ncbi:protein mab-21-like 3, partial [Carlito syrichta]|uniref:Protein mab-21-like 3 n=1 Tax=Carlito syrichta TaxID=1868482 RepID=A0A1U7UM28_CARSF
MKALSRGLSEGHWRGCSFTTFVSDCGFAEGICRSWAESRIREVGGARNSQEKLSIQGLSLLGTLPTGIVLHREGNQEIVVLLRTDPGAMKAITSEDFEDCLLNKVDARRHQISEALEEVQKVVHRLTTEISHQDVRFQAVPYSDSYNGNIKVLAPSQFLVTVPVKGLAGYREAREKRWRYYTVQGVRLRTFPLRDPEGLQQWLEAEQFRKILWQWHETDVNIEGDIVPAKVLQVFRKLVENAIRNCHLSAKVSMLENRSAVWVAVETCACQVELELAPSVEIPTTWSKKARWPRCLKRWPSPERVECIKSFGFDLLARASYHWQLSFLRAEQVLLQQLDEDEGCRRKCFQALRQLKEDVWCPGKRPVLTSHHLQ